MQDPVQEIKGKLDIVDVVRPYIELKQAGKYLKACCPFHQEKTPSFFVSPERQLAYCFSCQKGGDMFQFIQDIEGVDFRGALETLAEKANVELPKYSGGPKVSKDLKDRLKAVNRETNKFFVQNLWGDGNGEKVLGYLRSRGVKDEIIKEFGVGFAPDSGKSRDVLYRHLLAKKHGKNDILESSVCVARDSGSEKVSDRFWLRLMFPIDNIQGDFIGFNGRALKKDAVPKYLNSPEYVLYHKGSTIYNMSRAKKAIREKDLTIFVEGQFDVIMSWQAGIENVVATSGTALTAEQFKVVKRYSKRVALAFDADSAGQEALLRAVHVSQPLGVELYVIEIAGGKDAADLVKEDAGLWVEAVKGMKPYLEFFEEKYMQEFDLESAEGKKQFTDSMLEILQGVKHPVEQDHYLKKLSKLVGTPVEMLYDYLGSVKSQGRQRAVKKEEVEKEVKGKRDRLIEYFIGMILAFPSVYFKLWEKFENFEEFAPRARDLGLNRQMNKINEEAFKGFHEGFVDSLGETDLEFDVSSVYKQVLDHYNLHAEVDEVFYGGAEKAEILQKIAFEAEIKNPDHSLIRKEFEKLITLLYFEFTS
jgi:DNA primase